MTAVPRTRQRSEAAGNRTAPFLAFGKRFRLAVRNANGLGQHLAQLLAAWRLGGSIRKRRSVILPSPLIHDIQIMTTRQIKFVILPLEIGQEHYRSVSKSLSHFLQPSL